MRDGEATRKRRAPELKLRPAPAPIEKVLAAADNLRDLKRIAHRGIRYVNEIYAPNIKEPYSIANRRTDLVEQVRTYQARRGLRRAA